MELIIKSLFPIAIVLLSIILWGAFFYIRKMITNSEIKLRMNIQITSHVIVFISYPFITSSVFSLLNCEYFKYSNNSYLKQDLDIRCYSRDHFLILFCYGLLMTVICVFGFPLFILYKLREKSRKNELV